METTVEIITWTFLTLFVFLPVFLILLGILACIRAQRFINDLQENARANNLEIRRRLEEDKARRAMNGDNN